MNLNKTGFTSIEQVTGQYLNKTPNINRGNSSVSFEDILKQQFREQTQVSELKFSKHASQRLVDRNITLSEEQMERLKKGAKLSNEKGIKESLVVMDGFSFIVNTQNNTVITAMEQEKQGENIFTNIDGAVFV